MLAQFARPGSIVAVVSDSYSIFHAADKLWGQELRQQVIDSGATVVIRPDSGDPVVVNRKLIEILGQRFGYTVNSKGFKVMNNVRLIQGEGVNELSIESILGAFMANGWSADNIVFGCGGYLLQDLNRDTQRFALKCSSARINGVWVNVQKDPITDPGKKSKTGAVKLWKCGSEFESSVNKPTRWVDNGIEWEPALNTFYRLDGDEFGTYTLTRRQTFDKIRERANQG
jgi:nicotinamide phosphoribosyltransferase